MDEVDEDTDAMKSFVNGVELVIIEDLFARIFHLNDKGRKCNGQEFSRETLKGPTTLLNIDAMV